MLTAPTPEKLPLTVDGMAHAPTEQEQQAAMSGLAFDERCGFLVDAEGLTRDNTRGTPRRSPQLRRRGVAAGALGRVRFRPSRPSVQGSRSRARGDRELVGARLLRPRQDCSGGRRQRRYALRRGPLVNYDAPAALADRGQTQSRPPKPRGASLRRPGRFEVHRCPPTRA